MKKILVTGGCGYIGSHTIVELTQHGYDVISVDNNSRSTPAILEGVKQITGKAIKNYVVDLCNFDDTFAVFQENRDIEGIIHFAAYKAVGESVGEPLMYFDNNLNSLINILRCANEFEVPHVVFSSSCTVYGNPENSQVTEETPLQPAESPYGSTKQMGENIVQQAVNSFKNTNAILLRYFNPVGAHPSNEIGEIPLGAPANLFPAITQHAAGKIPQLKVFGNDYPTRDGSCVRDFIHVADIAEAHRLALEYLFEKRNESNCDVFNLGTGNGYTVLEVLTKFEEVNDVKLNYTIAPRRPGDVIAIYANRNKASDLLGWNIRHDLTDMVKTAWAWEQKISEV